MEDLIKALQIFCKYKNLEFPTACSHDLLAVVDISQEEVSEEDHEELERLGFIWFEEYNCFGSFRFGSA